MIFGTTATAMGGARLPLFALSLLLAICIASKPPLQPVTSREESSAHIAYEPQFGFAVVETDPNATDINSTTSRFQNDTSSLVAQLIRPENDLSERQYWRRPIPAGNDVAFVFGPIRTVRVRGRIAYLPRSAMDVKVAATLLSLGKRVLLMPQAFLTRFDLSSAKVVWLSESITSTYASRFFTRRSKPVVVCDPLVYPRWEMSGRVVRQDFGLQTSNEVQYVNADGTVGRTATIASRNIVLNYADPKPSAKIFAQDENNPVRKYVFAYPPKTIGVGIGTRVGCPIHDNGADRRTVPSLNTNEFKNLVKVIFNAAVNPVPSVVSLQVTPQNVLFTGEKQTQKIRVAAVDQFGNEQPLQDSEVEWVTTRGADISLSTAKGKATTVSSRNTAGYSIVVARAKNKNVVSPPVSVTTAKLQSRVAAIAIDDVAYPLPPTLPGETINDFPAISIFRNKLFFGGFYFKDILKQYRVKTAKDSSTGAPEVYFPFVVRSSALSSNTRHVVSSIDQAISGSIFRKYRRGTWTLLIVKAVDATEIYNEYKFHINADELSSRGLYSDAVTPQFAARVTDLLRFTPVHDRQTSVKQGLSRNLFKKTPGRWSSFNDESCATGDIGLLDLTFAEPTFKISPVKPRGGIEIFNGNKFYLFIYGGFRLEAAIRPEINVQASLKAELDCATGPKVGFPVGLSAVTASAIELIANIQPRLQAAIEAAGGPRLNAFVLAELRLFVTVGFRIEDGKIFTEDSDIGNYNNFDFKYLPDAGLTANAGNPFGNQINNDAFIDGKVGVAKQITLEAQLGGVILDRLQAIIGLASRGDAAVSALLDTIGNLGIFKAAEFYGLDVSNPAAATLNAGIDAIEFLIGLTQLVFVDASVFVGGAMRFESARKILNEADAGDWLADEHQKVGMEISPEAEVGLVDIIKFLKAITGKTFPLSITFQRPPAELIFFHKSIQAEGNIQHRVEKGSGNEEPKFEVGDRVFFRVPGIDGSYGGLDLTRRSDTVPRRCSVHTETITAFDEVGELSYKGTERGLHIFEGYLDVASQSLADYMNKQNAELFFLGWNKFRVLNVAGYLNSASGFSFTNVVLEAVEEVSLAAEVDKTAKTTVNIVNKSVKELEPVAVSFTSSNDVPTLSVTPSSGTFGPNSNTALTLEYECTEERDLEGKLTVTGKIPGSDPPVTGDVEIAVKVECLDVDCPLGAIPNPGGATDCACDSANGWIIVPNTNVCQCDVNRGYSSNSAGDGCLSCGDRDSSTPYFNTETRRCEECPFGAIVNPTGVTPCACDSSRGFFIVGPGSANPDSCECESTRPRYNPSTDKCEECPSDRPTYNPTTTLCEKDCEDPEPFFNPSSLQCEACPSATPNYNSDLGVCEAGCPGGSGSGNDKPFYGSFELGKKSGVFTFRRTHYSIRDRMQVIYEGRVLHDTGCTGGTRSVSIAYAGDATNVIVRVIPNCAGTSGTAWNFSVSCPA